MTAAHEDHAFPFVEMNAEGQPTAIETGMTLRQYAAIKLRVPNSGTDWLDEMIRESLRDELAGKAMQAFSRGANNVMFGVSYPDNNMNYALAAYAMADAMLEAREVKNGQG